MLPIIVVGVRDGHEPEMPQMPAPTLHPTITAARIRDAVERRFSSLDNPGFCVTCGADAEGCEPDAREYECEACGESTVYGAEELLFGGYSKRRAA